jgi:hypothetical protein
VQKSAGRRIPAWAAMATAAFMMSHQVGGKSIRDALFLQAFGPERLPAMVMTAAVVAVMLGVFGSRLFSRFSPARAVPWSFAASGLLQLAEWRLVNSSPKLGAVAVYLHMVAFSAVLLSSFWLLLSEELDPVEAKKRIGRIAGAGTTGSVLGGLLAAQWHDLAGAGQEASLLGALGCIHLICGLLLVGAPQRAAAPPPPPEPWISPRKVLRSAPHLRHLAVLVTLGTMAAAVLDFLYKRAATEALGRGDGLLEFFAYFNTGVALVAFTLQMLVSRRALEKVGVGRTVGAMPAMVSGGSLLALAAPLFPVIAGLRAVEATLRGSLFRAGYELMYTPIPPAEKRAAKTVIDVGCDRLGDALGGAVCQAALLLPGVPVTGLLLVATALIAGANTWVARQLDRIYVQVVERGLLHRAAEVLLSGAGDWTLDRELLESRHAAAPVPRKPAVEAPPTAAAPLLADDAAWCLAALRSGHEDRVKKVLEVQRPLDPVLVAAVIDLLAWDAVYSAAREALLSVRQPIAGQLGDRLSDPKCDFAIRRRIPSLLRALGGRRAVQALLDGLEDERFEVRFRCARALDELMCRDPALRPPADVIYRAVERELSVDQNLWRSRRLLAEHAAPEPLPHLDEVLRERADRSLEHLFSLLALVLPREPLKAAFRSLHSEDAALQALALEYLDGVLPAGLGARLRALLEQPACGEARDLDQVVGDLLHSHASLEMSLIRRLALEREKPEHGGDTLSPDT